MQDAPIVSDDRQEADRLGAVRALGVLDGPVDDPRFMRLVRLAARLFDAPKAAIALVDERRVWRVASIGYASPEAPRRGDLADRVVVTGAPADLASPIRDDQGRVLGAMVVEGPGLHGPASEEDRQALEDLAHMAAEALRASRPDTARMLQTERLNLAIADVRWPDNV